MSGRLVRPAIDASAIVDVRRGVLGGRGGSEVAPIPDPDDVPATALTFSDGEPLQFSDGAYLELAA